MGLEKKVLNINNKKKIVITNSKGKIVAIYPDIPFEKLQREQTSG